MLILLLLAEDWRDREGREGEGVLGEAFIEGLVEEGLG